MKIKKIKLNKNCSGFTLVELVVAMGIFLIIITLAIGAFVSVSRMKAVTGTMREVQQKTRISMEMITRLSRQADKVITTNGQSKSLELYFNLYNENPNYGNRFLIRNAELVMYECNIADPAVTSCDADEWTNEEVLLGNTVKLKYDESYFKKTGSIPPRLEVRLHGLIDVVGNAYYSNEILLDTDVILEGVK